MIQELLREATAFTWIDWLVTVTALIYVVLAARGRVSAWIFGIVSCSFWAYASYVFYQLYLDALLQIFYVVMGVIGIVSWQRARRAASTTTLPVVRMTKDQHMLFIGTGLASSWLFGYLFAAYTTAAATYLDAFTTVFSMLTTFLLLQRKLENWLYWIVIDVVYLYLYATRGAYLFSAVMLVYLVVAAYGYLEWKRQWTPADA